MPDEPIGTAKVSIVGDYSGLQADIDKATQIAAEGGTEIAQAFSAGAAGADALSGAFGTAATSAASLDDQLKALFDQGMSLQQAMDHLGTSLQPVAEQSEVAASGFKALGDAVTDTIQPIHQFSEAAQEIIDAQKQQEAEAEKNAQTLKELQEAYQRGAVSAEVLARAEKELGDTEETTGGKTAGLVEKLVALGAAYASARALISLGMAALEAADAVDDAGRAMALLSGNAEQATNTIEQLRTLANDAALGMPELLKAATRMTAFLGSSEQVPDVLNAVADSAAVMGKSIEGASSGFERIVASGDLSRRSLQQLGLTMKDVSEVMGVSGEELKKAFAGLDESVRVDVMIQALGKFKGAAHDMSDDAIGSFQRLKNQAFEALEVVGNAIEPITRKLADLATGLLFSFEKQAVAIAAAVKSAAEGARALLAAMSFNFSGYEAHLAAMHDAWNKGNADLEKMAAQHDKVNAKVEEGTRLTAEEIKAQVQAALARQAGAEAAKKQAEVLDALTKSAKEFTAQLPASYDLYTAKLAEGGKTAEAVLKSTEDAITKASLAMEGLRGKPLAAMQAVVDKLSEVHERAKAFAAEDAWNKTAQKVAELASTYSREVGQMDLATQAWIKSAEAAAAKIPAALQKPEDAIKELLELRKKLNEADEKNAASAQKWENTVVKTMGAVKQAALEAIPITVSLHDRIGETLAAYADMVAGMKAAGLTTVQMLDAEINKNVDLLHVMEKFGQPLSQRLELQNKIYTEAIKAAEVEGKSADALIVKQKNLQLQIQAQTESTRMWGDLYVSVIDDILKAYNSLAKEITAVILEGKNFGDAMLKVGKQLMTMIMEDLIATGLKALKNAFIDLLGAGSHSIGSLSGEIKKMQSAIADATKEWNKLSKAITDSASTSGGGTSPGAAGGGTAGTVTAIASVVNAISSIFGNFQMHAMNVSLDKIVEHTLRTFNILDQWYKASQDWFGQEFERLGEIWRDMVAGFTAVVEALHGGGIRAVPPMPDVGGSSTSMLPGIPNLPSMSSPGRSAYSTSSQSSSVGQITFHITEAGSARETARQVASALKQVSPRFAAYSS